ncbi:MAG: DUF72 domain-containing protein [Steroidobacteraceae bacterium]
MQDISTGLETMSREHEQRIHIGVGGWSYPPWRGVFYPSDLVQRRELEYASRRLTSIEINSTFYGLQKPASFAKWHAETPAEFVFSLKAPRFVTGRRRLADAGESIRRFFDSGVLLLQDKLGPVNWQLGPEKAFDAMDLEAFFTLLPRKLEGRAIRHAIEVRHPSFLVPGFPQLAQRHGISVVLAGDSEYPAIADDSASVVYARLMGTSRKWKKGYPQRDLENWALQARQWADEGREVFLYVIGGFKERNPAAAMALIELTKI